MSARAISTGSISFGLVSIPVKLYSTNQPAVGISFNLLHKKDNTRLKQQYICPKDNEIVPRDEMVKGYEFAKDQYVIFTEEELKLAMQFVGQLATDKFEPKKYEDEYRKRLQEIIDRKAQGQAVTIEPAEAPKGQIIDLMEALKASLSQQSKQAASVKTTAPAAGEERKPPKRSPRVPAAEERKSAGQKRARTGKE